MSRAASFEDVTRHVDEFGDRAMLVSVTDSGAPHVVSVVVERADDRLLVRVGPGTRANVGTRPAVSLVWPPVDGGDYQLIVDGVATPTDDGVGDGEGPSAVSITVTSGILHRLAGLGGDAPSCVSLAADERE